MARLADGDRSAFDPLYEALWPLVRRLTQRMLLDAPEAEDAAQEALIKLFARASDFEPGRSVQTWVLAITAYECKTLRRKQLRRREHGEAADDTYSHADPSPEAIAIARDFAAAASEVLGTLRPVDIETLEASIRGTRPALPQATFRKRLERAVGRLRTAWSSRHGID
jgi:RNA polymerase sigma-70 factor (ECF subfamily)